MTIRAIVKGGQVVLSEPLPFPDGTPLTIQLEPSPGQKNPLLYLAENAVSTGIPDLADQHDHYTYGSPKKTP